MNDRHSETLNLFDWFCNHIIYAGLAISNHTLASSLPLLLGVSVLVGHFEKLLAWHPRILYDPSGLIVLHDINSSTYCHRHPFCPASGERKTDYVLGKSLGGMGHAMAFLPMPSPRARQDPQLFPVSVVKPDWDRQQKEGERCGVEKEGSFQKSPTSNHSGLNILI